MSHWSNCHIYAWSKLIKGDAVWLAFRKTHFARLSLHAKQWYWQPLVPFGITLQWAGSIMTALGWLIRWGSWYHMVWVSPDGKWWEFAPEEDKHHRIMPPAIFKGKEQRVA